MGRPRASHHRGPARPDPPCQTSLGRESMIAFPGHAGAMAFPGHADAMAFPGHAGRGDCFLAGARSLAAGVHAGARSLAAGVHAGARSLASARWCCHDPSKGRVDSPSCPGGTTSRRAVEPLRAGFDGPPAFVLPTPGRVGAERHDSFGRAASPRRPGAPRRMPPKRPAAQAPPAQAPSAAPRRRAATARRSIEPRKPRTINAARPRVRRTVRPHRIRWATLFSAGQPRRRLITALVVLLIVLTAVLVRVALLQTVQRDTLRSAASEQWTARAHVAGTAGHDLRPQRR